MTKDRKSIIVYSMHRSASTFMIDFLRALAKESDMRHGHIDPMLESQEINARQPIRHMSPAFTNKLSATNVIYGPFRRFAEFPTMERYNSIMVLRDPRDVLVSLYYAQVFSHGPPPDPKKRLAYLQKSQRAKQIGIDQTVVEWSDNMVRIYDAYIKAKKTYNVPLLSYGDMVTHFDRFLHRFLDICELKEFHSAMMRFNKFDVPKENIYAHKRQAKPGDHARKLTKDTIKQLDAKLGHVIHWLSTHKEAI